MIQWQTKVSSEKNIPWFFLKSLPWLIEIHVPKISFNAILCAKMPSVYKPLQSFTLIQIIENYFRANEKINDSFFLMNTNCVVIIQPFLCLRLKLLLLLPTSQRISLPYKLLFVTKIFDILKVCCLLPRENN